MDVREIRAMVGCTQIEFSKMVGISHSNVTKLERGTVRMTPHFESKIRAFCEKHGIECDDKPCLCAEHLMKIGGVKP